MKHAVIFGGLFLATSVISLSAFDFQDPPQGTTTTVEMTGDNAFRPKEVTVRVGDTVVWKNASPRPHTVTTDPDRMKTKEGKDWAKVPEGAKPFHSGEIARDRDFRYTFTIPGTYQYACTLHEDKGMMGTVTVKPKE